MFRRRGRPSNDLLRAHASCSPRTHHPLLKQLHTYDCREGHVEQLACDGGDHVGQASCDKLRSEERHAKDMLLIQPRTLRFKFAPDLTSCCCVLLQNTSAYGSVSFKMKTTAPEAYLVKPARGVLPFQATVKINIFMQPRKTPPSELHQFLLEVSHF